jgi:hypothetical protein
MRCVTTREYIVRQENSDERRFHDAGADRVVVRPPTAKLRAEMAAGLERVAEAVLRSQ